MNSYCIAIPCYRHGKALGAVLTRLETYALPVVVVDDGNEPAEAALIEKACAACQRVTLLKNPKNLGKGGALITALKYAATQNFSHVIQLDADGQHCLEDLPRLMALSEQEPSHLISACPIYDDSVPKARLYGRYATHMWVWIETLSLKLKDSMCGYRIYPLAQTLEILAQHQLDLGMDFDTEIMVHLFWAGTTTDFLPSKVSYPQDGISNFKALQDNLKISLMHTRLCIYLLTHLPSILRHRPKPSEHWARTPELKGLWGMRLMLWLVKVGGRPVFTLLLYPVIGVYYLSASKARKASRLYFEHLRHYAQESHYELPVRLSGFRHFYGFGQSMLEKILAWQDQLKFGRDVFYAPGADALLNTEDTQGKLILGSHLGTLETSRALGHFTEHRVVNALVFTANAARFKQIMDEFAPKSNLNLIAVTDLDMATIELLQQKIAQGEYIAILGDRIPVQAGRGGYRVSWVPFLGQKAPFPQGPFILASLLKCPVIMLHALKEQGKLVIYCQHFADRVRLDSRHKPESIEQYQKQYAHMLEQLTLSHPLDWFNFYDFWSLPESPTRTGSTHAQD